MTSHGTNWVTGSLRLLGWMQRHYPWSVLWVLFMVTVGLLVGRFLFAGGVVAVLCVVIALQAVRAEREAKKDSQGKV